MGDDEGERNANAVGQIQGFRPGSDTPGLLGRPSASEVGNYQVHAGKRLGTPPLSLGPQGGVKCLDLGPCVEVGRQKAWDKLLGLER